MDEFERVRRRKQGEEAKRRVMERLAALNSGAGQPVEDEFAVVRNRPVNVPPPNSNKLTLPATAFNQPERTIYGTDNLTRSVQGIQAFNDRAEAERQAKKAAEEKAKQDYLDKQRATRNAQDPKNPVLKFLKDNTVDAAAGFIDKAQVGKTGIPGVDDAGKFLSRFGQKAGHAVGVDTQKAGAAPILSTGSKAADITADLGGAIAGWTTNPANIGQGLASMPYKIGQTFAQNVAPKAGPVATRAIQGSVAGAVQGGVIGGVRGETDADQMAMNIGMGALGGAVGDVAMYGLGRGISKLASKFRGPGNSAEPAAQEVLALPEPRQRGNVNRADTPEVIMDADVRPLGLPSPSGRPQGVTGAVQPPLQRVGRAAQVEVLPAADVTVPKLPRVDVTPPPGQAAPNMRQRGFAETLQASDKPPLSFKERMSAAYQPIRNADTLAAANLRISRDIEEATSFVLGDTRFTAEKATVAQRLIDHYNGIGNHQRAVDIAMKVSEEATTAGQANQALSMFNRLSPEGVLVYAQRVARKTNEKTSVFTKDKVVTPDMAANLQGLAAAAKKMTGIKELSNNVNDILDRAKSGVKLTESEAQTLRHFVNESKQFIKETSRQPRAPRAPRQPKDNRVRDNLTAFLDAQEQAAKERLRSKGIQVSSTPLDVWMDYAIIGAAKMGKQVIRFSDWSEEMVKELGEDIRPHLRQLYERSMEAYEASTKKVTRRTISEAEKLTDKVIRTKQLEGDEANSLRELAKKVSSLSGDAQQIASQDLQVILMGLDKPGILKRISTFQTIGQLLNTKTMARNVLGNELFYRLERINKWVATPIDIARSKITGGERTVTFRTNNQGEFWRNWVSGGKAGWKQVNVNGLQTAYDLGSPAFTSKLNPLTYLEKALGATLKSFDTAAYMRAYNNTVGEMATLRAINEGQGNNKALIQQYIREADENILKIADEYGRYVTFQDNNLISQGLVKFKRGLNVGKDFGVGDLVIKYPKTPGALLMRALEYSPAGFLRSAKILMQPIFKKEPNTAEVTQALTRAIIGTAGLSGMGYYLMDVGILTGSASKDRDIRGLQQAAGQGQYQVNLSALTRWVQSGFDSEKAKLQEGDRLYTYDWMQPASIAISIGANVKKNLTEGKDGLSGTFGTVYNSLEGGLGTLTEQSVLSGLKSAVEGYPGQSVTDKIMDVLTEIPASFVPTAFNQFKQMNDNYRRETYSPNKLEQSLNRAQAKIPIWAESLPQQYDTLGNPKETYQDNNVFNVMFNPGFTSKYKLSPEAKYIVELIAETGDETLAPRVPGKKVTIEGQTFILNGDMFSRLQQLQGEETKKRINKRMNQNIQDPAKKSKRISKELTRAGDEAKKQLGREYNLR
ncbi:hypothetical protein DNH61_11835 [Paenibacillus sambharensis]|uniref:Large polyvalent protein associated domain-containing protein n=1 Tax=Paenibacillus sambharensis TaxID=1803190 RepID=A0A2W1L8K8_9BACL|nr:hypothetical protein [Paenibacillus sambharensis]PZD95243.1 hypothetical protein DNH61_11835 [Paenibacillus sambharensis]